MNNPVAFNINGFEVRWYGILIALGILVGVFLASYNCKRKNVDFEVILDGFLIALPSGIIGARLYYVAFELDMYKDNLVDIFNIRLGGLAIHGGIIGAFLAAYIFSRVRKINILEYMDVVAPSLILAQAIGRWGNFMNSEAHGGVVTQEYISNFPDFIQRGMYINGIYYHPTFLYESIWNIIVCLILILLLYKKQSNKNGIVIFAYVGLYSLGRFFIEGLRTDSLMFLGLRIAQIISLVGIVISIIGIVVIWRKSRRNILLN